MKLSSLPLVSMVIATTSFIAACSSSHGSSSTTLGGGTGGAASSSVTSTATTATATSSGQGGIDIGFGGSGGAGGQTDGGAACDGMLPAVVRDFSNMHPDFAKFQGDDKGIVAMDLGADGKPVYAGSPKTPTTTGQANFDQWYNDVSGVNIPFNITIPLTAGANGVYTYDNEAYFPIDDQGFGNEYLDHNFSFTTEVHTQFTYKGGEVFTFIGDDDLFVFINKKLVINLGGVHNAETGSVKLDDIAASIGISVDHAYSFDLFGAERHPTESHFRLDTTIGCFKPQPPPT